MAHQHEKMAARYLIELMLTESKQVLRELRKEERAEFDEVVAEYKRSTGATGNISIAQLAVAEVDMLIASGDALRERLEAFEIVLYYEWGKHSG